MTRAFALITVASLLLSTVSAQATTKKKAPTEDERNAMVAAIYNSNDSKIKALKKRGVSLDVFGTEEVTGLMRLADEGSDDGVAHALDLGADINVHNEHGESALWYAVYSGHERLALSLIKRGASAQGQRPDSHECLMHMAAQAGLEKLAIRLMTLTPACASQKDLDGRTPSDVAKSLGYTKLAKALKSPQKLSPKSAKQARK